MSILYNCKQALLNDIYDNNPENKYENPHVHLFPYWLNTCNCRYVCVHICMCTYMYVCVYVYIYICVCVWCMYVCMYVYIYIYSNNNNKKNSKEMGGFKNMIKSINDNSDNTMNILQDEIDRLRLKHVYTLLYIYILHMYIHITLYSFIYNTL